MECSQTTCTRQNIYSQSSLIPKPVMDLKTRLIFNPFLDAKTALEITPFLNLNTLPTAAG